MRWWLLALLLGCPGPSDSVDGGPDAALDAPGSTANVQLDLATLLGGSSADTLADGRHRVTVIRADVDALEWGSDASENVRVEIFQQVDFFGESALTMQLPPGRYSVVELDLASLEMVVDDELAMETEPFTVRARCSSAIDLGVGSEQSLRLELVGETLLDELATRLEDDPPSEAIRESFKEAIRIGCD